MLLLFHYKTQTFKIVYSTLLITLVFKVHTSGEFYKNNVTHLFLNESHGVNVTSRSIHVNDHQHWQEDTTQTWTATDQSKEEKDLSRYKKDDIQNTTNFNQFIHRENPSASSHHEEKMQQNNEEQQLDDNELSNKMVMKNDKLLSMLPDKSLLNITVNIGQLKDRSLGDQSKEAKLSQCTLMQHHCHNDCTLDSTVQCSCHVSCKQMGDCCENFSEKCLSTKREEQLTQCVDNSVLVTSCDARFNLEVFQKTRRPNGSALYDVILPYLSTQEVLDSCYANTEVIQNVPVTDTASDVHYKNLFCAVCNNVSDLQFWDGILHCPFSKQTTISSNDIKKTFLASLWAKSAAWTLNLNSILETKECRASLQPIDGQTKLCFEKEDPHSGYAMYNDLKYSLILKSASNYSLYRLSVNDTTVKLPQLRDRIPPFQSIIHAIDTFIDTEETNDTSALQARCDLLKNFAKVSLNSKRLFLYKCMHFLQNLQQFHSINKNSFQCFKSMSVNYNVPSNYYTILMFQSYDNYTSENDQLGNLFQLRMNCNYTFQTTRMVRGNVNDQVERFFQLITSFVSNSTDTGINCTLTRSARQIGSNNNQQATYMFFDCEVYADVINVTDEEMRLNKAVVVRDVKVYKIMKFAEFAVSILSTATETVSLPVTVDSYMCIMMRPTVQVGSSSVFCKNAKAKWTAVREKNAIIGSVSLEGVITIICCSMSIVGLFFRLAFQNIVTVYKSYPGKVQFSLCLSLLLSYMFFLVGGMVADGSMECRIVGIFTHMAFLSALFWMNVTAFEIWRTFRHWSHQVVSRGNTSLVVSSIYAIGGPAMIISGAIMVEELAPMSDFSPEYGVINCWLNGSLAVAVYFVIPCSALCCSNVIFVGLTLRGLRSQRTSISEFKFSSTLTAVNDTTIVVKISLLVGITWLLGLVAAAVDQQPLWIIFTIINASLGFFISVVLVLNKRVYLAVKSRCNCSSSDSVVSSQVPKH